MATKRVIERSGWFPLSPGEHRAIRAVQVIAIAGCVALAALVLASMAGCTAGELRQFAMGADDATPDIELLNAEREADMERWLGVLDANGLLRAEPVPTPDNPEPSTLDTMARLGGYGVMGVLSAMGIYNGGRIGSFATRLRKKKPNGGGT